jgi:hypothetical protein
MKPTLNPDGNIIEAETLVAWTISIIPSKNKITGALSKEEQIEANKDKLDLKPNVDFVSKNVALYELGIKKILQASLAKEREERIDDIEFINLDKISYPQVSPEECQAILLWMPKVLLDLSRLKTVNYYYWSHVPVPEYDENGDFVACKWVVHVDEFPWNEHPTRVLVGNSDGFNINPSAIPKTVSEDEVACYLYQVHVFLHEFFHTIEYNRTVDEKSQIILETDWVQFSFQDWWQEFEDLILSWNEPKCVSSYANTYFNKINIELKDKDNWAFTYALAENICETFVAYHLNIISNDDWWTDFKSESFWNVGQLSKFIKWEAESANQKWILMDKLCRASLVK